MLHVDIPARGEVQSLLVARDPASVSIYLATRPSGDGRAERLELKALAGEALEQLRSAGADPGSVSSITEALDDLVDDDPFWAHLANSLAVFATPSTLKTFRLPSRLGNSVAVSDRFHLKPLLRSVTFPQAAFVLALAQGSARLLEIGPEGPPSEVKVEGLPDGFESTIGETITDRSGPRRIQGGEGKKVRLRQYARQVDQALRSVLSGLDLPLILATTEPLGGIFRSVTTYPYLAEEVISGSPERRSSDDLAATARTVLDAVYAKELRDLDDLFDARTSQGRTATDVAVVARAATFGAVDTLFVDIDVVVPGSLDEETGEITVSGEVEDAATYSVLDEIARRVLMSDGRVLAVRADDVPGGGPIAGILRYRFP